MVRTARALQQPDPALRRMPLALFCILFCPGGLGVTEAIGTDLIVSGHPIACRGLNLNGLWSVRGFDAVDGVTRAWYKHDTTCLFFVPDFVPWSMLPQTDSMPAWVMRECGSGVLENINDLLDTQKYRHIANTVTKCVTCAGEMPPPVTQWDILCESDRKSLDGGSPRVAMLRKRLGISDRL